MEEGATAPINVSERDSRGMRHQSGEHEIKTVIEGSGGLRTRADLRRWIHDRLSLSANAEKELLEAFDQVLFHYEGVWRDSKDEALRAVASGFAMKFNRLREELDARDVRSHNVAQYFEHLVNDLTERTHRDAKTQLLNFRRFMEHVALSLAVERHAPWCALGVADITSFKAHNDTLGHAACDRIIETVARILRSEVRSSDRIAYQQSDVEIPAPLHARFGGDEFCFFLSDLEDAAIAWNVADRFWQAVARHDWSIDDSRLAKTAVNVDIGLVCLEVGTVSERHVSARVIADELFARADKRLYAVKRARGACISCERVRFDGGRLVDIEAS